VYKQFKKKVLNIIYNNILYRFLMEIVAPEKYGFTVYSKSGCQNCLKIKTLLKNNQLKYTIVDCDEYLIKDKELFKKIMKKMVNTEDLKPFFFPIVFNDQQYLGGYNEFILYIEKLFVSFENLTF